MNNKAKVIIIGGNHINTLGLIRSIGEVGIKPDVILEQCNLTFCFLRFSKYINKLHLAESIDFVVEILKKEYINVGEKSIILCGSDNGIKKLDAEYDYLSHFFTFSI